MNKINRVILCIVDNLRSDHLFQFVKKGWLPNIEKLMEEGIYSKNCITDFPPITYPTQVSLLTGTYTGDFRKEDCHGVPLMNWMGRDLAPPYLRDYTARNMQIYKLNDDIGNRSKTIFEMVGEENTASIGQFINRGADYFFPEKKTKLAMYYLALGFPRNRKKMMVRTDSGIVHKLIDVFKKPKKFFKNKEVPILSVLWFMTPDILLHFFGSNSQIYKLNILHIDKVLGELLRVLKRMGYLNDTAIALTSDHGNYKAQSYGEITNFFEPNLLTHYHPRRNLKGNMNISKYDGVGFFNFKGNKNSTNINSWYHPTILEMESYGPKNVNLLQELFKIKGSHLMYYRDENNTSNKGIIHLRRKIDCSDKITSGTIEYKGTGENYMTKYSSENSDIDIFGFLSDQEASKLLDNKFHTSEEWLRATYHLDYPLHPDLIPRHFKNPRSCDIILSNDGSLVFNLKNGKKGNRNIYNHDRGIRDCMNVPLIIGGNPEVPQKEITSCKITDIIPTLLELLGKTHHKSIIGRSLI
ncbi:MAG: alkaline phosphatase family protein [Promethearchaeota archaeon]